MKYLFIVQGEGRGHMTQALSMCELLIQNGHEVVEVLVGKSKSRVLPRFFLEKMPCNVEQFDSPNFLPSANNKKSLIIESIFFNLYHLKTYVKSINFINERIKKTEPDVVINFYEMLAGITYAFCRPSVPYVCVGHQYLFLHPDFVFPKKNKLSLWSLRFFSRLTCLRAKKLLALSFVEMRDTERIKVVPPLVRKEVLQKKSLPGNYVLGYMVNSGFSEEVKAWHTLNPEVELHFFWDKKEAPEELKIDESLTFHQLDDVSFLDYMSHCKAYASTGGFESICEAMYLKKPVMMVPAHIEQECNAYDAMNAGAGVVGHSFNLSPLMNFVSSYKENNLFIEWVSKADNLILKHLEK